MSPASISKLTVANTPLIQKRNYVNGEEKDVGILSLRLLHKRNRVRLSPKGLDYSRFPGKSSLFAVGNHKGYFVVIIHQDDGSYLQLSNLSDIRESFESDQASSGPYILFTPQCSPVKLPGTAHIVKFALNDDRIVIGFLEGPVLVYNTNDVFNILAPSPTYTFPGDASMPTRDIQPNPGESPELVAVMRSAQGQEMGHEVDILDVREIRHIAGWRRGDDPTVSPVCISWSPRGKQIAIGLQSGDILLYNPLLPGSPKSHIPKSSYLPADASALLSITWLANHTFHMVFSSAEASSLMFDSAMSGSLIKTNLIFTHDPKARTAIDIELLDPSPPFGASFPPGPLSVVLRGWSPMKFIVICGDGPSADIGLFGALTDETWVNITLEETSTPSLPLGEDSQDMVLLGLDMDLNSSKSVRVSEQPDDGTPDLPPSPILYAYMSDGTIVAWHILNASGDPYPGMTSSVAPVAISPATAGLSIKSKPMEDVPERVFPAPVNAIAPARGFGTFVASGPSKFGATSFGFAANTASAPATTLSGATTSAPAFGSTGFGKPAASAFGQTGFGKPAAPAFGQTGFSKPPAPTFGQTGFGAAPAFGQSSFGTSVAPPKGIAPPTGGFATFAAQSASGFGVPGSSSSVFESEPAYTAPYTPSAPSSHQLVFGSGGVGQSTTTPKSAFGAGGSGMAAQQSELAGSTSTFRDSGNTSPPLWPQKNYDSGFKESMADALNTPSSPGHVPKSDSPPSPTAMGVSPPDSPNLPPVSLPQKPTSSYLKPASGFGAFVNTSGAFTGAGGESKPISSFIKPAGGFGAAHQTKPTTSFAQTKLPAPAFGSTGFDTPIVPGGGTTKPTFGSVSALGSKPVFGASSFGVVKSVVSEPSKPISGGFGAFSSGGGFASFANPTATTSFSDLLSSSSEPDKSEKEETPLAFGKVTAKSFTDFSAFSSSTGSAPSVSIPKKPADSPTGELDKTPKAKVDEAFSGDTIQEATDLSRSEDSTFSLLSLSEAASQAAKLPTSKSTNDEKPSTLGIEAQDEADDADSEPFYLTDSTFESDLSEGGNLASRSPTPSLPESEDNGAENIPLPETSTPTPTPSTPISSASGLPAIDVPFNVLKSSSDPVADTSDKSNTLPSPPQQSSIALQPPIAPKPSLPNSAASAFGLGRPSSRPIRSSPLANAPITSAEDEDSLAEALSSKPTLTIDKVAEVTTALNAQVSLIQRESHAQSSSVNYSTNTVSRRPKTPPMLGNPLTQAVTEDSSETGREGGESPMHPMQIEFQHAYEMILEEVIQLQKNLQIMLVCRTAVSEPRGLDKLVQNNQEFIPSHYSLGELTSFTIMIDKLRSKVAPLLDQGDADKRLLQNLQNLALISQAKQEELSRWVRAHNDSEFAKTIKPRTLGPEHAENQIRLRKALQSIHERVQQCEDQMESLKKRLDQEKTGRMALRPPSLDTIDRTCRNIQLALEERAKIVEQLQVSIDELSPRDIGRLQQIPSNGVFTGSSVSVAPPFANIAAAALNSERSSLKLKDTLLNIRKRPLLTTRIAEVQKPSPVAGVAPSSPTQQESNASNLELGGDRRRGRKMKTGAVPLPKVGAADGKPAMANSSSFDWGLLPTKMAPTNKLPFDLHSPK